MMDGVYRVGVEEDTTSEGEHWACVSWRLRRRAVERQ